MALPLPQSLKQSLPYRIARGLYRFRDSHEYKIQRQKCRKRRNWRTLAEYLASADVPRLQIGSGNGLQEGWLNTDYLPDDPKQCHLDAAQPFDIPSDSFDLIYCEHMIEHIPFSAARSMLRECRRTLKAGGRIRIATPPLEFLIEMVNNPTDLHRQYIDWHMDAWKPDVPPSGVGIANDFVRNFGHVFMYDEATLRGLLTDAGFVNIELCRVNESPEPLLRGLEREGRMPPGLYALSTFVLEARPPD